MSLDTPMFAAALRSGIHRVMAQQESLNRINVFPVADGDTGTNLSMSLGAALKVLGQPVGENVGLLLASVADALLDGARGNSGAIVAQFFQGMSDAAEDIARLSRSGLCRTVSLGNRYAHDALAEPREGTILSVIAAFAHGLEENLKSNRDISMAALLGEASKQAQRALEKTPEQLDVLRKAGVVDAGASGFMSLVDGFREHLVNGVETERPAIADAVDSANVEVSVGDVDLQYRYCTECIVTGEDIDRRKLRERLSELGNSLVLAGTKKKAKIHIHVDEPQQVFDLAAEYGALSSTKADDMQIQRQASSNRSAAFAVITDSAADISDEDLERLDIHVVPCRIQFGDRGYLDKVSISPAEFFEELARNPIHPTTSQPAPGDFRRQFQYLASHYPDVISINLTPRVSGTHQSAVAAAARVDADGRIHVVDSMNASLGQGLLAVLAAECADRGMSVDATLETLDKHRDRTISYGLLADLDYAVRGGRIPHYVKKIADWLRVTPVIRSTADGNIGAVSLLPGRTQLIRKFSRYIARRTNRNETLRLVVGHANAPDRGERLLSRLGHDLPNAQRGKLTELGSALGVHGGPGTLVVSTQVVKRSA